MPQYVTPELWDQVNSENKQLMREFEIQLKQEGRSISTITTYRASLRLFCIYILEEIDNQSILKLGKKAFRNYSLYLKDRGVSNATHNHYISAIKSLLDRMEDDDEINYEVNMARRIKGLRRDPVRPIMFLTDQQVEHLYNELLKKTRYYQLAFFLSLAYDSGARRAELMQVTKDSFYDPSISNTNIVIKKGGKRGPLIYFDRTKQAAAIYFRHRGEDNNPSAWMDYHEGQRRKIATPASWCETMSRILSEIEGKHIWFTPHSLRHSAIENLSEGTHYRCEIRRIPYSIDVVRDLVGHASSDMTQSYKRNKGMQGVESAFGIKLVM